MAFDDDFDLSFDMDSITSRDSMDDINGLLDEEDLTYFSHKSAAYTNVANMEKEDTDAFNHVTGGFDPSEFADTGTDVSDEDDDEEEEVKPKVKPIVVSSTGYKNKMEHAKAIYAREHAKGFTKRAHFIALFQSEAGCTPAGASTYYATIKNS